MAGGGGLRSTLAASPARVRFAVGGQHPADVLPNAPERARRGIPFGSAALLEVELAAAPERRGDRGHGRVRGGNALALLRRGAPADARGGQPRGPGRDVLPA